MKLALPDLGHVDSIRSYNEQIHSRAWMWLKPRRRIRNEIEGVLGNSQHSQAGRGKDLTRQNEKVGRKGGQNEARKKGFMQVRWNLVG